MAGKKFTCDDLIRLNSKINCKLNTSSDVPSPKQQATTEDIEKYTQNSLNNLIDGINNMDFVHTLTYCSDVREKVAHVIDGVSYEVSRKIAVSRISLKKKAFLLGLVGIGNVFLQAIIVSVICDVFLEETEIDIESELDLTLEALEFLFDHIDLDFIIVTGEEANE